MRNSLILKNIPEDEGENNWDDTKCTVATHLSKVLGINKNDITNRIERAHRGGKKSQKYHRNIYIRLYSSEDVKYYIFELRKLNMAKKTNIIGMNQYSKKLTERRNQALYERKKLKDKKEIISGYVKFPAILMIKREGDNGFVFKESF